MSAGLAPSYFMHTSLAVNPNAEDDLWLADGNAVYHSTDSGATWTKLSTFASIWSGNAWPVVQNVHGRVYVSGIGQGMLYSN